VQTGGGRFYEMSASRTTYATNSAAAKATHAPIRMMGFRSFRLGLSANPFMR